MKGKEPATRLLRIIRGCVWVAIVILAAAVTAALAIDQFGKRKARPLTMPMQPLGGAFSLVTHEGKAFTEADLRGKPYALFFGFTHCPDVCPTTLFELSERMKELGTTATQLTVVFVSIDPERDTPQMLKLYLESFHPGIIGLTGTESQVDEMVKAYRGYHKKVPLPEGGYTMDHTAIVYLFDQKGELGGTLDRHETADVQRQKLQRLLR